ncbi:hypothetical protein F5B20DRAFT_520851 [Whalleya microplaca]|nr:hypothetical protein F5B20DRAFT_520851 [Whalleya microplaca]
MVIPKIGSGTGRSLNTLLLLFVVCIIFSSGSGGWWRMRLAKGEQKLESRLSRNRKMTTLYTTYTFHRSCA